MSVNEPVRRREAFRELLMTNVRQACREISIFTRTLTFDAFGQALLAELEYACQRRVQVRCLIDPDGSQDFIGRHPILFTRLETRIRIAPVPESADNIIIFDRKLAVAGSHELSEPASERKDASRIITGAAVIAMADKFDAYWNGAIK